MHLTDIEMTVYAEALMEGKMPDLSEEVVDHVSDCEECSREILSLKNSFVDFKLCYNKKNLEKLQLFIQSPPLY